MTLATWSYRVGLLPHRVLAYEDPARKGVVYLRWRVDGDWVRRSLGFTVRDAKGKLVKDQTTRAQRAADEQYAKLIAGGVTPKAPSAELTIAEGWTLATDAERGYWTKDTPHRREMARAIDRAKAVWGARTAWNSIERGDVRRLWRAELKRQRAKGNDGVRSTEILVTRVMTLAGWLREEGRILPTACAPWKLMKKELAADCGDYAPRRLRYTPDEFRALLVAAPKVDARWALLLAIGAEYRLGQVVRMRRVEVDRALGAVVIRGRGNKRGVTVVLTPGQQRALEHAMTAGYLAGLEAAYAAGEIEDYPLFPGQPLPIVDGQPVTHARHATRASLTPRPLGVWLRETEAAARVNGKPIEHVPGRGWYGLRRVAVDLAKAEGISREGLQQGGGWADTQTPDRIYADQKLLYAAEEAARVRAKIRGEVEPAADAQTEQNGASNENTPTGGEPEGVPK